MSGAMLCFAAGAVASMGWVGRWVHRVGSGRALTLSGLLFALALLVFGVGMAAYDVAMNRRRSPAWSASR